MHHELHHSAVLSSEGYAVSILHRGHVQTVCHRIFSLPTTTLARVAAWPWQKAIDPKPSIMQALKLEAARYPRFAVRDVRFEVWHGQDICMRALLAGCRWRRRGKVCPSDLLFDGSFVLGRASVA